METYGDYIWNLFSSMLIECLIFILKVSAMRKYVLSYTKNEKSIVASLYMKFCGRLEIKWTCLSKDGKYN